MTTEKTKIFKALSDPNRLRILKMLQMRSLCVCEITDVLQLATSTVSNHLKVLRDMGFIIEKKEGKWVNYMINSRPTDQRVSAILSQLDFWIDDQSSIIRDKELVIKVDREKVCGT